MEASQQNLQKKEASEQNLEKKDFTFAQLWKLIQGGPLLGLFLVLGLEIFGAAMTIPVFVFFCIETLKLNATSVGILVSAFNLAQAIGSPVFGRVSDATGRRVILLTCFAWSSVCFVATSFANSFGFLLCIRTFAGLSGGSIPVVAAVIMDSASVAERPSILGVKGAFIGLCFTLGPTTTVILTATGVIDDRRQIFLLAGAFCFSGFLVGMCILRESLPAEKRRPLLHGESGGMGALAIELQDDCSCITGGLVCAWLARFFYAICIFTLYTTFGFILKDNFGWADQQFGMFLAVAGVSEGLLTLFLYPKVDKLVGEHVACILGFTLVAIGMLLIPTPTLSIFLLGFAFFQLGQSFAEPGVINLVGLHCPQERYMGFAQGAANGFRAMGSVIAPVLAGNLYDIKPFYAYGNAAAMAIVGAMCVFGAGQLGVANVPEQEALQKQKPGDSA